MTQDVPNLERGSQENETTRKSHTLTLLHKNYPQDSWAHVLTDGSATRGVTDGRVGIFLIHLSGKREEYYVATGKHYSSYKAKT